MKIPEAVTGRILNMKLFYLFHAWDTSGRLSLASGCFTFDLLIIFRELDENPRIYSMVLNLAAAWWVVFAVNVFGMLAHASSRFWESSGSAT